MKQVRLEVGSEPFPGLKLVQLLGKGGFAEVWEGVNSRGDHIAVKFMAVANTASSVKEMRIIQAIQKISHRGLLRVDHVWSLPKYIVVAMELADGSLFDLQELFQTEYRTALAPNLVVGYLKQAAASLDFLNARRHQYEGRTVGFQHCDIKPSNLLLVGETVKLADFGLCTPTVALQSAYARAGTMDFASPEVHRGHLADSSDQYSLAVTYFYLRTSAFPFPAAPRDFKREYSYTRPAPDLSRVQPGERRVLERALDLEPTNRWPSCTSMMAAMQEALGGHDSDPPASSVEKRLASTAY